MPIIPYQYLLLQTILAPELDIFNQFSNQFGEVWKDDLD